MDDQAVVQCADDALRDENAGQILRAFVQGQTRGEQDGEESCIMYTNLS